MNQIETPNLDIEFILRIFGFCFCINSQLETNRGTCYGKVMIFNMSNISKYLNVILDMIK